MNPLDYHILLALANGPLYGLAIRDAVEAESGGRLNPRAGSLYRVIARLIGDRLVNEVKGDTAEPHPGLARRYYALTATGKRALTSETARLKFAAGIAEERLGMLKGGH